MTKVLTHGRIGTERAVAKSNDLNLQRNPFVPLILRVISQGFALVTKRFKRRRKAQKRRYLYR